MTLDILIPQYKETDEIVKPLLDSIALQQNVDFNNIGVIIVNDGSDVFLSDKLLSSYPFKIKYYKNKHAGVSATRQKAFDLSKADYVMWCDADDMFYNMCGLWIIFREMQSGFDSLVPDFIEEARTDGVPNYITHKSDSTFVHGKVHRRKYLKKQKIKWNPALTIHEDGYFNTLCQKCSKNVKYGTAPFYLWKWRDDSVCRSDFKYILKTYNNLLDSYTALVHEFEKRKKPVEAKYYASSIVYHAYFTMNKDEWINQENKEYRDKTELRFKAFYLEFKKYLEDLTQQEKMLILKRLRDKFYLEGMLLETVTFDSWIKHIEAL